MLMASLAKLSTDDTSLELMHPSTRGTIEIKKAPYVYVGSNVFLIASLPHRNKEDEERKLN